jgi:hypothetical protein
MASSGSISGRAAFAVAKYIGRHLLQMSRGQLQGVCEGNANKASECEAQRGSSGGSAQADELDARILPYLGPIAAFQEKRVSGKKTDRHDDRD